MFSLCRLYAVEVCVELTHKSAAQTSIVAPVLGLLREVNTECQRFGLKTRSEWFQFTRCCQLRLTHPSGVLFMQTKVILVATKGKLFQVLEIFLITLTMFTGHVGVYTIPELRQHLPNI